MTAWNEIYGKEPSKEKLQLYEMLLKDLSIGQLERALPRVSQTCKFYPTPADIREATTEVVRQTELFAAEKAWESFKRLFGCWHPDIGLSENAPKLDPAGEYAMRIIGGVQRFANSEYTEEHFIRREFLDAYKRYKETGGMLAPTREEARQLLDRIMNGDLLNPADFPPESDKPQ